MSSSLSQSGISESPWYVDDRNVVAVIRIGSPVSNSRSTSSDLAQGCGGEEMVNRPCSPLDRSQPIISDQDQDQDSGSHTPPTGDGAAACCGLHPESALLAVWPVEAITPRSATGTAGIRES